MSAERVDHNRDRQPLRVELNNPFSFTPDLSVVLGSKLDREVVDRFDFMCSLGEGSISFFRDLDRFDLGEHCETDIPAVTPAGPVNFSIKLDGDNMEVDRKTMPISVEVSFKNLDQATRKKLDIKMLFRGREFKAAEEYLDLDEPYACDIFIGLCAWVDSLGEESCDVYFPPDPKVLNEVKFVVSSKS